MVRRLAEAKLHSDVASNYAGLVILAAAGIVLNFVVVRGWGEDTLGVFNLVLAAYVVVAMFACGGLHTSALRAASATREERGKLAEAASAAILIATVLSALFAIAFYFAADLAADVTNSPGVAIGMRVLAPGLFAFSLGKVFIAIINGLEHMRMFAALQAMRGILVVSFVGLAWWKQLPGDQLPIIFTATEILILVLSALYVAKQLPWWRQLSRKWLGTHARFGLKNFMSGVLIELNARVDILMLGVFVTDERVGIYSFAALFGEGFFQLVVVTQNIFGPKLARLLSLGNKEKIAETIASGRRLTYRIMLVALPVAILGFPVAIAIAGGGVGESRLPFSILAVSIAIASGLLTFQNILAMGNRPGWQSIFMATVLITNVAANAILIPRYEIIGAAIATAGSFLLGATVLTIMSRRLLKVRLVF